MMLHDVICCLCHVISSVLETCRVLNLHFLRRSPISATARARWRKSGSRTSTQKRGGDTTGSDKGEPQRAQTDQPDPQLIKHKRDEKKKSYEIFLCLDDFRCGHKKNLNKLDQTCRDPYLISNKYQNVLELLGN